MLVYLLIGLLFILIGVTGLQFTYLFWADRLDRERKICIRELERRSRRLADDLETAEKRLAEQDALLLKFVPELKLDTETWADVLDDH
jgi:hypothetical protein